jgi:hypothetical protein
MSYLCAVTATWALNLSGGAVNLLVYGTLVRTNAFCATHPIVGAGAGLIAGLVVTFEAAQRFVYNARGALAPRE